MKAKGSFKAVMIMTGLCGIALFYLYLHASSIRLTRELVRLELRERLLLEEIDTLKVAFERLSSFCRLESLYIQNWQRYEGWQISRSTPAGSDLTQRKIVSDRETLNDPIAANLQPKIAGR